MNLAMHNLFIGVVDAKGEATSKLGAHSTSIGWKTPTVAFADAPVWRDLSGEITVSGEIVLDNASDLRRMLSRPCAEDGEILAEAFRLHGSHAGVMAQGMYAVAIHDARTGRVHLLRDAVGCRTMYYGSNEGSFWFATRLSSLEGTPVCRDVSLTAVRDYLTYSYVPGSQTMWSGVREVRPGTIVSLPQEKIEIYWEPQEDRAWAELPIEDHAARLRDLLEEAVCTALPSRGEPVGIFLSGGLDSSLVTAIAARFAGGALHTYSVHFGSKYANELEFSEMVAKHCGTQHHVIEITPELVKAHLAETMAALDDPIGDPLTVPNLLLGRRAAEDCDVILNGEGGDPCFGGPKNHAMLLHRIYDGYESDEEAYLRSYRKCYSHLGNLLPHNVGSPGEGLPNAALLLSPYFCGSSMSSFLNQLMHINVRLKGADHILTKVNNLTRANGLSGHSPIFDRRVIDASFAAPAEMKLLGIEEKLLLKQAVTDLLPDAVLNRPKSGMMVPVNGWTRNELRSFVSSVLCGNEAFPRSLVQTLFRSGSRSEVKVWRYIEQKPVLAWLQSAKTDGHGARLWMILSLELWLRAHT